MTLGFSTDEIRSPIRGYGVEDVDMKVSSSLLDIPLVPEKHSQKNIPRPVSFVIKHS